MIDPRAIIDPSAEIADDVKIGPWSIIGPGVSIASGCDIRSHVIIKGPSQIGKNNTIYQFSSVGEDTPDMKYGGEPTRLVIGDNNVIREGVTIHRGTVQDIGETRIGDHNLIMAYAHIGHDSVVGNHCVLVNNASLAGHVHIGDWAILGGYTLVHQFCHIGTHAFTGFGAGVGKDIPAYIMAAGSPASAKSINTEGLRRRGFSKEELATLTKAFKLIYRRGLTKDEALQELAKLAEGCDKVLPLMESLQSSSRGITR